MLAILASYGLYGEEAVHAARGLRSVAHVFASLEVAGGLGMILDPGELRQAPAGLCHRFARPTFLNLLTFEKPLRANVVACRQGLGEQDRSAAITLTDAMPGHFHETPTITSRMES